MKLMIIGLERCGIRIANEFARLEKKTGRAAESSEII